MCFTFSICPSSGYWSRIDLNCWMSDGWIKSNPSSSLFAEQQIKETDIRGKFQRNQTQRPDLRNVGTTKLVTSVKISRYLIILVHLDLHIHRLWIDERRLYNLRVGINSWKRLFKNASLYLKSMVPSNFCSSIFHCWVPWIVHVLFLPFSSCLWVTWLFRVCM